MNDTLKLSIDNKFPIGFPLKSQRQKQLARVQGLKEVIKLREAKEIEEKLKEKEDQKR